MASHCSHISPSCHQEASHSQSFACHCHHKRGPSKRWVEHSGLPVLACANSANFSEIALRNRTDQWILAVGYKCWPGRAACRRDRRGQQALERQRNDWCAAGGPYLRRYRCLVPQSWLRHCAPGMPPARLRASVTFDPLSHTARCQPDGCSVRVQLSFNCQGGK